MSDQDKLDSKATKVPTRMARQLIMGKGATTDARRTAHLRVARLILRMRDARDRILGEQHFADPAWDLLLELYIAKVLDRPLTVGDACIGSRVPLTTGLRWIAELERVGKVARVRDPVDRRRTMVVLTDAQTERMDRFFVLAAELLESPE